MQQRTEEWLAARKGRLTGSNVGAALGVNPWKTPDDLIRQMVREYHGADPEFTGNVATEYGQLHEPLAVMDYSAKTGNYPEECGFFVHPEYSWLGASPDGLINDDAVLEVKCPYGLRNDKTPVFKTPEAQPHYYAQMQIEMACTGRTECHFYQWAPNGDALYIVFFDTEWFSKNISVLEEFYRRYLAELDNPEHLEPKQVEINTLSAKALLDEYDKACRQIDEATARKKEIISELADISKDRNALIHGRKLTKVERKGSIDYGKVPELKGVNLEPYRKSSSEFWKLS